MPRVEAKAEMLIRRPVVDVVAAFVDPAVTTRIWFTKSSGRLEPGKRVRFEHGVTLNLVGDRFPKPAG